MYAACFFLESSESSSFEQGILLQLLKLYVVYIDKSCFETQIESNGSLTTSNLKLLVIHVLSDIFNLAVNFLL